MPPLVRPVVKKRISNPFTRAKNRFIVVGKYQQVTSTLQELGWKHERSDKDPNIKLIWTREARLPKNLGKNVKINHMSNINELSVKSRLTKNLKTLPDFREFYPDCFVLGRNDEELAKAFLFCEVESKLMKHQHSSQEDVEAEIQIYAGMTEQDPTNPREMLKITGGKDPQFSIRGPQNIWIVKPADLSRGRSISLVTSLQGLSNLKGCFVIQKYIERPLLVRGHKFDIRQWILITYYPLKLYVYKDSYLRFSAAKYNSELLEDPYIHLTNNSISKTSTDFAKNASMMHSSEFGKFLQGKTGRDVWSSQIWPSILNISKKVVLCAKEKICQRKNSFELLGLDLMIDDSFKVWLIEVNTSPAMDYSTNVTHVLVKRVLSETIRLVLQGEFGGFHHVQDL